MATTNDDGSPSLARTEFDWNGGMRVYDDVGVLRVSLGYVGPAVPREWTQIAPILPTVKPPPPAPPTHRRLIFRKRD